MHLADACDDWCECSDDWDETGEDNCFRAVFFVKYFCFFEVIFMKNYRVFSLENFWANFATEGIAYAIACDCSYENDSEAEPNI